MNAKKNIDFDIGETVVYPKHGVGEIISIESMEVSSIKTKFYVVKMEQAKLTIRVPLEKQEEVGLRKISSKKTISNVFDILKLKPKIRRIMWSRRAQEYEAKIFSGDPVKIGEVVRDLFLMLSLFKDLEQGVLIGWCRYLCPRHDGFVAGHFLGEVPLVTRDSNQGMEESDALNGDPKPSPPKVFSSHMG